MIFRSNSDMVKHYARELLSDGKEHTLNEIINYVYWQNGRKDVSGGILTQSTVNSALWKLFSSDNKYVKTKRGHYQLNKYYKLTRILKKAEMDVCQLLTINLCTTKTSRAELLETQEIGQKVREHLILAIQAIEASQSDPLEEQSGIHYSEIYGDEVVLSKT